MLRTRLLTLTLALAGVLFTASVAAHEVTNANGATVNYTNWVNLDNKGCCNSTDCSELPAEKLRTSSGNYEVFVEGVGEAKDKAAWCPVLHKHYLKSGNAPNWATAHYCVTNYYGGKTPCEQFVCFQPQPSF